MKNKIKEQPKSKREIADAQYDKIEEKSKRNNKRWIISIVVAVIILASIITFDLVSKHFAELKLGNEQNQADFIPGFINFVLVYNNGGGWNIFAGHIALLVVFSVIVISLLTCFYALYLKKYKGKASVLLSIAYGLIFGGFFGNLFDRLAFGRVRDFINFQFMSFPVFNIADISLCIGTILLLIFFIFIFDKKGKQKVNKTKEEQ